VQARDGVVQLVAMPAVPARNSERQRTLQRNNDKHRPQSEQTEPID
jgi:hypothetical protein